MRIEKLELIGFKSFAEKTTFNFHPGITCIVGPNGCGKSNIVDAFRWVLGEQSAKSLRGEKMEEVIFNGSASKKPKGMAEVTLVISGLNGGQNASNEDAQEISDLVFVTRRLYRSGDSEYILNKNQCRLKDIKDLFLDTGLEVKSYSILEQDKISEILNAKPQERRFLIEEVAGIMKYNVRKKEALAKLDSSRLNLQRINDIIAEVKRQINLLDRLAKKAEKYKRLSSEMRSIELKIAKRDYEALKHSLEMLLKEYHMLKEEESLKKAELSRKESKIEAERLELVEKEKALEQIQSEFRKLERDISELEKIKAVAINEKENNTKYLEKLYQQGEEYKKRHIDLLIRQEELLKMKNELLSEIEKGSEFLREKMDFIRSKEEELLDKEKLLELKRKELFKVSEELSNIRNEQNRLQSSFESVSNKELSELKEIEILKSELSDIDSSLETLKSILIEKDNELSLLEEKKAFCINEITLNIKKADDLREKILNLKEELASNISRLESLKEIVFDESTKDLLSEGTNFNLLATISDIIEVEDEYEKAIESALSEKINSFILPSLDEIEIAVSRIKNKGLGRTAFVTLDPLHQKEQEEPYSKNVIAPEGSIGRASSFIKTTERFSEVAKRLLDNIFIVRDLKTAFDLISTGHNLLFVTLDGDVVEPSGAVIAGEVKGIFRRKREIKKMESIINNNRLKIDSLYSELNLLQEDKKRMENSLKEVESKIVEIEKEVSLLRHTAENTREEQERKNRKLEYLSLELEQILKEKEDLKRHLSDKELQFQSITLKRDDIESQNRSLQEEISKQRSDIDRYRSEITDIRLSLTSCKERVESIIKELENLIKEIEEQKRKKEYLFEEITTVRSKIEQREEEIRINEEKIKSLVSIADNLKVKISEKKYAIDSKNQELVSAEQNLKSLRNHITHLSQRLTELDIQKAEHKLKMENLSKSVDQNYGLNIESLELETLTGEEEKRLIDLREKISELGAVNLGTLEEYEELRNRYEFLKTQQEDLMRSIEELEEAIKKINTTTRRKLKEAFEALRIKFAEVFTTLFGGGRAELIMTDENNIFETGIDIIAQPPGKRLQNINLLSGGEKVLTALSLLFASFLIKPTPLCILDEADSGLDEANTEKFAKMLLEFSKDTQFIVVTHNKNTMSVADYIYGVTMEEAGVSKVISMQLVEA